MNILRKIRKKIFKLLPLKNNRVCFINFNGLGYGCNPKYIAEEMIKQGGWDIYWIIDKNVDLTIFPQKINILKMNKIKTLYYLSTSKFIISNARLNLWEKYNKKHGQIYIQTWHGGLGLKKVEADCTNLNQNYVNLAKKDSENIDFLLTDSKFQQKKVLERAFWYKGQICKFGLPRHDIFFQNNKLLKSKVLKALNIDENVKICMYAPTFRDENSFEAYELDYKALYKTLKNKFGGDWIILSRLHPNLVYEKNTLPNLKYVHDASKYADMQELLAVTDIAISDYSSCLLDFMITKRPAFIFATDIENYTKERDFYISLYDLPFKISKSNKELMTNIKNFNSDNYTQCVNSFLTDKGLYDKGDASRKLVNLLKRV